MDNGQSLTVYSISWLYISYICTKYKFISLTTFWDKSKSETCSILNYQKSFNESITTSSPFYVSGENVIFIMRYIKMDFSNTV